MVLSLEVYNGRFCVLNGPGLETFHCLFQLNSDYLKGPSCLSPGIIIERAISFDFNLEKKKKKMKLNQKSRLINMREIIVIVFLGGYTAYFRKQWSVGICPPLEIIRIKFENVNPTDCWFLKFDFQISDVGQWHAFFLLFVIWSRLLQDSNFTLLHLGWTLWPFLFNVVSGCN